MRTSWIALGVWSVAAAALAAERCQEISDVVASAVVAKPKFVEVLKKNPEMGTLGDPGYYLWYIFGDDLKKLRVSDNEQQYMFRTIGALSFSKKLEVDVDIFRDYFYLCCKRKERGLSSRPLESISAASLVHCWDTVANRAQFRQCEEKLMDEKSSAKR